MALPLIGAEAVLPTSKFDAGLSRYISGLHQIDQTTTQTASRSSAAFSQMAMGIASLAAGLGAGGLAMKAVMTAARVEELGVILQTTGQAAGYTRAELDKYTKGIAAAGITTRGSLQVAAQFISSNLNMSKASELARAAQDAATIASQDSTQALEGLLHGIVTLQPEILRTYNITVDFGKANKDWAAANDRTVESLTGNERQMIALNAVLVAAKVNTGAYEASMTTASKQLRSMTRYVEELELGMGQGLLPVFSRGIFGTKDLVQWLSKLPPEIQGVMGATLGLAGALTSLAGPISMVFAARQMMGLTGNIAAMTGARVAHTAALGAESAALGANTTLLIANSAGVITGARVIATVGPAAAGAAVGVSLLSAALGALAVVAAVVSVVGVVNWLKQVTDEAGLAKMSVEELNDEIARRRVVTEQPTTLPIWFSPVSAMAQTAARTQSLTNANEALAAAGGARADAIDRELTAMKAENAALDARAARANIVIAMRNLEERSIDATDEALRAETLVVQNLTGAERDLANLRGWSTESADIEGQATSRLAGLKLRETLATLGLSDSMRIAEASSRGMASAQSALERSARSAGYALREAQEVVASISRELQLAQASVQDYLGSWFIGETALRYAILDARRAVILMQIAELEAGDAAKKATAASMVKFDMLSAQQRELAEGVPVYVSLLEWQRRQEESATQQAARGGDAEEKTALERVQDSLRLLELRQSLFDLDRSRLSLMEEESRRTERTFGQAAGGLAVSATRAKELEQQLEAANKQVEGQQKVVEAINKLQEALSDKMKDQQLLQQDIANKTKDVNDLYAGRQARLNIITQLLALEGKDAETFKAAMKDGNATLDLMSGKLVVFGETFDSFKKPLKLNLDTSQGLASATNTLRTIDEKYAEFARKGINVKVDSDTQAAIDKLRAWRDAEAGKPITPEVEPQTEDAEEALRKLRAQTAASPWEVFLKIITPPPVDIDVKPKLVEDEWAGIGELIRNILNPGGGEPMTPETEGFGGGAGGGVGVTGEWQSGTRAVPGPVGLAQMAMVHGGERIISPLGGGGTVTNNSYNWAPTVTTQRSEDSLSAMRREYNTMRLTGRWYR